MNEEDEQDSQKKALTESFLIDGDINDLTGNADVTQKPKKKKKKKVKKSIGNLDDLQVQSDSLSQSLADIRDNALNTSNSTGVDEGAVSDNNSDYSTGSDSSAGSMDSSSNTTLIERQGAKKFFLHLQILLSKTFMMFARNKAAVLVQIFCPIIWCLCLKYFNTLEPSMEAMRPILGNQYDISPVAKCFGENCVSIGYSIIGDPQDQEQYQWIDEVMQDVAIVNKFKFNEDVKKQTVGDSDKFMQYLDINPNITLYSVVWCTTQWDVQTENMNISVPCDFGKESKKDGKEMIFYTLWYNNTLQDTRIFKPTYLGQPKNPELIFLQESIDNAILTHLHNRKKENGEVTTRDQAPYIQSTYSDYPEPIDRVFKNLELMGSFGAYYFTLGPLLTFMILLQEIAKEKELKLRQGLNVVGVSHVTYWISWLIVGLVLNFLQTTVLIIMGNLCQFQLFQNAASSLMFYICFWMGQSMVFMAYLFSTFVKSLDQANQLSYSIILANILVMLCFTSTPVTLKLFYSDHQVAYTYIRVTTTILELMPTFSFALAFGLTTNIASRRFDFNEMNWVDGVAFGNDEYYMENESYSKTTQTHILAPSVSHFTNKIKLTAWLYFFMFLYFDHVLSSNRGVSYSFFFPFQKSYWKTVFPFLFKKEEPEEANSGRLKRKIKQVTKKDLGLGLSQQETFESVQIETEKILEDEKHGIATNGLRVVGVEKVYRKWPLGFESKDDVYAVRGIYLDVPRNELLCLLGHNGAGKSTLFNMLTGIIGPSEGYAKICNLDIRTQQEQIRKIIGVVPQFDILWDQLTAMEHMRMFSKIKGVPNEDIEEQSVKLLDQVGLEDVKNAQCGCYSGGMKRRLSVAISAIGNPKVIFFDEPTTGMDPVSRRAVWQLMQDLKKDKTIILTTHAMEEADALADRIAVVVDGKIKCVGTPLNMKNTFGDGYRVSMVCEPGNEQKVIRCMDILAPSNKFVDDSGGAMVFTVPLTSPYEIAPLFKLIEDSHQAEELKYDESTDTYQPDEIPTITELKTYVTDCGISHSTLEEVFMKVTGKKKPKTVASKDEIKGIQSSVSKASNQIGGLTEQNIQSMNSQKNQKKVEDI